MQGNIKVAIVSAGDKAEMREMAKLSCPGRRRNVVAGAQTPAGQLPPLSICYEELEEDIPSGIMKEIAREEGDTIAP